MDNENQATPTQNDVAVEANSPADPSSAEPTTSVQDQPATDQQPVTDDTAQKTEQAPEDQSAEHQQPRQERRNAERESRIRQLVGENKQLRGQYEPGQVPQVSPQAPRLSELVAGKESIDPTELDKLGEQVYQQGAQTTRGFSSLEVQQLRHEIIQREAISEAERESSEIMRSIPELNPENDQFNPALDKVIAQTYQRLAVKQDPMSGRSFVDPNVKLSDVATDLVELARSSVESGKSLSSAALARQADNSAVLPNSDTPAERSFSNMSLQEQEAYLRSKGHDV